MPDQSDLSEDELYEQFLEKFCSLGERSIDLSWPQGVQRRCRLLLHMASSASSQGASTQSFLSAIRAEGVAADISLEGQHLEPPPDLSGSNRYAVESEIARGGMGRILLAYDQDFRRRVAMKVLVGPPDPGKIARFVEEAQATAQLEHPNIGPVYDGGLSSSGAPFFTMKWIRGRDLSEIIEERADEFSLFRLVQILQQVAMGIDFAHSRGVVHRDLKPQNVMVGDYGEVLVVDWGLAKILGRSRESGGEQVMTSRVEGGAMTLDGSIQGSAPYMSPEQALGDVQSIDSRTDVFGLGAILYAFLTGLPLYEGSSVLQTLQQARRGSVVPPVERTPEREIPPELEEICLRALSKDRDGRFQSAREFYESLQRYVEGVYDGERRASEAERLLAEAASVLSKFRLADLSEKELRAREEDLSRSVPHHAPPAEKEGLWDAIEQVRKATEKCSRLSEETVSAYYSVLRTDPGNVVAREALADFFSEKALAAESRGDREASRLYTGLVAQYHQGRYEELLTGERVVHFHSVPEGAEVHLSRYEEKGLRLLESPSECVGTTPLPCSLALGSYVATFKKKGLPDVRYPVFVDREAVSRGPVDVSVHLYAPGEVPEGFVQVPAGESIVGGDPHQLQSFQRRRQHFPELFVARFPVTLGQYCEFLNDFPDPREFAEKGDEFLPSFGAERYVVQDEERGFVPQERLHPGSPVMCLRKAAMLRYCGWLGQRLGQEVRLLTEEEWERCARGADGRLYPWGNGFDWAFCHGALSREERPWVEPVSTFSHDTSPFGVRDLAGCVRELCQARDGQGYSPSRGGSWYQRLALIFRADARLMRLADRMKTTDVGFRVCYSNPRAEET